jgi:hypothetical protein
VETKVKEEQPEVTTPEQGGVHSHASAIS